MTADKLSLLANTITAKLNQVDQTYITINNHYSLDSEDD